MHPGFFQVCILDEAGRIESESRCETSVSMIDSLRCSLRKSDTVIIEASSATWEVYDLLKSRVGQVVVVDPHKTKLITQSSIKTDRRAALTLAQLGQDKHLAQVWVPDKDTRQMREIVGFHRQLTKMSTRMSNIRTSAKRAERLTLADPKKRLLGSEEVFGRSEIIESATRIRDVVREEKASFEIMLAKWALSTPEAMLLMKHMGVGPYVAAVVLAASGDMKRFPDAHRFASYTGMVPRVYWSGETKHYGRITKAGRKELRHALIQAAHTAVLWDPELKSYYSKLYMKKGSGKAIVAVARKIATRLWHLLVDGDCDGLMSEEAYERKIKRLDWEVRRWEEQQSERTSIILDDIEDNEEIDDPAASESLGLSHPCCNGSEVSGVKSTPHLPYTAPGTALGSIPTVALSSARVKDILPQPR